MVLAAVMGLTACSSTPSSTPASTPADSAADSAADVHDAWPNGEVTVYVPAAAGGNTDTAARFFTDAFKEMTGENFVVVNDTTGANSVAYETVRNAEPDGNTLMVYHGGMCLQYAAGQYDHSAVNDFTIIGALNSPDKISSGIWVNGDSPFQTLDDLITYAKEHPGDLTAGVEVNNADHMLCAMMEEQFGIEFTIVSAGSNSEKLPLLLGGNVDVCFLSPVGYADYHTSGDLRCLAMMGETTFDPLPEVPTFADLGHEPLLVPMFCFIAAPKGTPEEVCKAIDAYISDIYEEGSVPTKMNDIRMFWDEYYPMETARQMVADMENTLVNAFSLISEE